MHDLRDGRCRRVGRCRRGGRCRVHRPGRRNRRSWTNRRVFDRPGGRDALRLRRRRLTGSNDERHRQKQNHDSCGHRDLPTAPTCSRYRSLAPTVYVDADRPLSAECLTTKDSATGSRSLINPQTSSSPAPSALFAPPTRRPTPGHRRFRGSTAPRSTRLPWPP